jgi:hypothetical protein
VVQLAESSSPINSPPVHWNLQISARYIFLRIVLGTLVMPRITRLRDFGGSYQRERRREEETQ